MRKLKFVLISVGLILFVFNTSSAKNKSIRILIFSGRNNHEWKQTTLLLNDVLTQSGIFKVEITNQPDTLKTEDFNKFNVVLSNWNSWPENDLLWPGKTENALLQFIEKGGGFVTFHASTSVFYKWPDFQKISTAAWIMDKTSHGKRSYTQVTISDKNHPVTKGMKDFSLFDELWLNAAENPNFKVLGYATNEESVEKGIKPQPAIFVAGYGKGRIFHTILGHDLKAMQNDGFLGLILRGTEWAATGEVTQPILK